MERMEEGGGKSHKNPCNLTITGTLLFIFLVVYPTIYFLLIAKSIATAIATVAPTIGLLPIPRKPIIST